MNTPSTLTCPNCDSPIWGLADQRGDVTIECSNISCGVQWNGRGDIMFAGFSEAKKG